MRRWLICSGLVFATLVRLWVAADASPSFVTIDVPGAKGSWPTSINAKGAVTGNWTDGSNYHGFVRQRNGAIETFDVPGSDFVQPNSINKKGFVTGICASTDQRRQQHAFIRSPDGTIQILEIPKPHSLDDPVTINSNGEIIGDYLDDGTYSGFIRDRNGVVTHFFLGHSTLVYGGNDLGEIAGYTNYQGYEREPDGSVKYFQADGFTLPAGINNYGTITGQTGPHGADEGFVRTADGSMSLFAVEGSSETVPAAINDAGTVVGYSTSGTIQGFARASDGTITTISVPGATSTNASALNSRGVIVGYYVDQQGNRHGFIRYP